MNAVKWLEQWFSPTVSLAIAGLWFAVLIGIILLFSGGGEVTFRYLNL